MVWLCALAWLKMLRCTLGACYRWQLGFAETVRGLGRCEVRAVAGWSVCLAHAVGGCTRGRGFRRVTSSCVIGCNVAGVDDNGGVVGQKKKKKKKFCVVVCGVRGDVAGPVARLVRRIIFCGRWPEAWTQHWMTPRCKKRSVCHPAAQHRAFLVRARMLRKEPIRLLARPWCS